MGGDVKKSGFSHEFPYEPPPRPDVYFDARSDGDGVPTEPPPTGQIIEEEEAEVEVEEVVAGLLLLLAVWEFGGAFMAAEQATCQFNQDIMQPRSVRIQL